VTTDAYVDIPSVVRETICQIGYDGSDSGFDYKTCAVLTTIDEQSSDIAQGVNRSLETRTLGGNGDPDSGAGDQGMMFGYANSETDNYMPMPIFLAHQLTRRLSEVRKSGLIPFLRPDGKSQVTIEYEGRTPKRIEAIVVSSQHISEVDEEIVAREIREKVILSTMPAALIDEDTKIYINPTGRFVIGGPQGDSGLTGRKIIVDTYGGFSRHGGGAFSGKDPTKVDRSAAYAARYIAKNIVAAGIADECEIQLAYAIGVARPVSILVESFGTGKIPDDQISNLIR
jgi:S-adenosylmethionine synthetase